MVTVANVGHVIDHIKRLPTGTPIAVDTETTGLHPYQGDTIRGFSFAFREKPSEKLSIVTSYYVPVAYPDGMGPNLPLLSLVELCQAIHDVDPIYVYHHAKFDLRFLRGLPRRKDGSGGKFFPVPEFGKLYDTKVVAFLIDENLSSSLGPQAQLHLGEGKLDAMRAIVKERGGWDKVTASDTAEYGAKDAELTLRLREVQLQLLAHPMTYGNPELGVEREHQVLGVLLRMEDNGIKVDHTALEKLATKVGARCEEIENEFIHEYAVNINSPQQVAVLLFDTLQCKRKDGKVVRPVKDRETGDRPRPGDGTKKPKHPTVARAVLETLEDNDVVLAILEQRKLKKALTSYLRPLQKFTAPDGRVHPTFWQHGTVTGRFSCSDPNLQTIPRHDTLIGVRDLFVAEDGMELWGFDLNAAEMRVVAGMAQEDVLIEGIESGADMHARLAERVFGPDFTGIQRRYAKNIGYGFFYGLTSPVTAAKYIAGPGAGRLAQKILDGLKAMYPNVVRLMRRSTKEAELHGFVRIHPKAWPGRYRRFITEADKKPFPYTALNAKVQGGIGEFVKDVMVIAEPNLDRIGARLCLQVHDELVIEVPAGRGLEVLSLLNKISAEVNPFDLPMPFTGSEWSQHE